MNQLQTTVVITLYNDLRVKKTIDSLFKQTHRPDHILIADGGSPPDFEREIRDYIKHHKNIRFNILRGRCIDTRRKVIDMLVFNETWIQNNYSTDIIAFIDSDEVAEEDWLGKIVGPIASGIADFASGKTVSVEPTSNAERILAELQDNSILKQDISYTAMGNSAWSVKIFKTIGNFDNTSSSDGTDSDTIAGSYHVSDDFDINLRALNAGFKGKYVHNAIIYHNQSHVNSLHKLIKYMYGQYVRTVIAYFKHGKNIKKFTKASKSINHPFELFLLLIKPIALLRGWIEWRRYV